jgi:hypothetical protein
MNPYVGNEKKMYADAILVQDAPNLSGIVHSWAEILSAMVQSGMDTKAIWNHPVNVMFADKVSDLTGRGNSYSEAYRICREKSDESV